MNHAQVIIDKRESRSKVPKILEKSLTVQYLTLPVGDYQIATDITFERKSYDDFCHSIKDGRLFRQASELAENFKNPVIILEGGPEYGKRKTQWKPQLPRKTVLSACLAVTIDLGVPILPTLSQADTARVIIQGVERLGRKPRPIRTNTKKKGKTLVEKRQNVLEAFPGVGPKLAAEINQKPYSLLEILKAINECQIQGLGPKKIKQIKEVLNGAQI